MMAGDSASPADQASGSRAVGTFYAIALFVVALDQLTKLAALRALAAGEDLRVLGPVMSFSLRHNTGAAWGLLAAHTEWLTYLAAAMAVGLLLCGVRAGRMPAYLRIGLPLLLGGAVGNLCDRLSLGAVVDFIDFHFWPVFNVADIAIVAGALLIGYHLVLEQLRAGQRPEPEAHECDQS